MKWDYSKVDTPTIYVDVDGTLLLWKGRYGDGVPKANAALIAHLSAAANAGTLIYLWSRAGAAHAKQAAEFCGCRHLFTAFLHKPQQTFDDDYGWLDAVERGGPAPPKGIVKAVSW